MCAEQRDFRLGAVISMLPAESASAINHVFEWLGLQVLNIAENKGCERVSILVVFLSHACESSLVCGIWMLFVESVAICKWFSGNPCV